MGRIKALLAAPFQRRVGGDERAVLEDANRVGENMDVEDPTSRRVRHAVEIAADAHHAFVRGAPLKSEHRPIVAPEEALARAFPRRRPR